MLNNKNPFCVDSNLYPALRQVHSINAINGTLFLIQKYAIENIHFSDSEICELNLTANTSFLENYRFYLRYIGNSLTNHM